LANAERHPGIRLPQHLVAEEASARQSTSRGPLEGARRPLATHEVEEVAEKVMTILDRRIVAQRERRGKRS
jgi:hypothetical protein